MTVRQYDIIILGAGYGGLMAALNLAGARVGRIALINERAHFVERIRLQEAIAAPVAPRLPALVSLPDRRRVDFICGEVVGLDAERSRIAVRKDGAVTEVAYRRCIYALGSHVDEGAVPGVGEFAWRLDPGEGALSVAGLRSHLMSRIKSARIVVVGGANTATEAAGEIKSAFPAARVTMISRSGIGDFKKGERLKAIVRAELTRLGVDMLDQETVVEVRENEVLTASGLVIPADICVWGAGLRAPSLARKAGVAVDNQDRILVGPTLSSISHPDILAVGDAAHPLAPTGARYRMSAFAAIISGAYAAQRLRKEAGGRRVRPFSYSAYGQGVAIGRRGVGFFTFPDDGDGYFILRGQFALHIRNLFVWFLVFFLRLERRFPGLALFWIGRRRVSWAVASKAMQGARKLGMRETMECIQSRAAE